MNYEHAFHAGNAGDVLKHVVLVATMMQLLQKPTALFALDTHAGSGLYSLVSDQAQRTGEAEDGIRRLNIQSKFEDPVIEHYRQDVLACQQSHGPDTYPGSPWLIAHHLRNIDRLSACELDQPVYTELKHLFAKNTQVAIHHRDGYVALTALLPPKYQPSINRGLVLIDPPYELQLKEFDVITRHLQTALQRWPQACYLVWYPIKQRRQLQLFYRQIKELPSKSALCIELLVYPDDSPLRMNGSGMLLLNAPWQLDQSIMPALRLLSEQLSSLKHKSDAMRIEWLRNPS